jgi:prolyl 4-hydroxylase
MSNLPFRWRTIFEVAVISAVIYVVIGTPGLPASFKPSFSSTEQDVPVARAKAESLVYPSKHLQCPRHDFDVHFFSTDPLVMYIDGFLSESEAEHLVDIRYPSQRKQL